MAGPAWLFNLGAEVYGWFTAQAAWRASCARLAVHLPAGSGLRVVDLGCGPGVSTFELARARPDALLVGVDVAPRMLAEARRRLAAAGVDRARIHWVVADAAALPFRSSSVDATTAHSFLYLVPDRSATLAECWRVLRGGGRLVLMEPSARPATVRGVLAVSHDLRHLVSVSLWRPFSRLHGRFTAETLGRTLAAAGFAMVATEPVLGGLGLMARAEKPAATGRRLDFVDGQPVVNDPLD